MQFEESEAHVIVLILTRISFTLDPFQVVIPFTPHFAFSVNNKMKLSLSLIVPFRVTSQPQHSCHGPLDSGVVTAAIIPLKCTCVVDIHKALIESK